MGTTALRRGRPTVEDSRRKMADVLEIAREQFSEYGYRAVTMRDVADKAQVSTRTLYNRYADKLTLFKACLDGGADTFPHICYNPDDDVATVLQNHAVAVVRKLSDDSSLRMGTLVYREGAEFPEMLKAAEDNQEQFLVTPLADYLRDAGLSEGDEYERSKLFIAMTISEWQRSVSFRRPLPERAEVEQHAKLVVSLFLGGTVRRGNAAGSHHDGKA